MAQDSDHVLCDLYVGHGEDDQAVLPMTKHPVVEPEILGEECRARQTEEIRDDVRVEHPLSAEVASDLPGSNAPTQEQILLVVPYVLVEHDPRRATSSPISPDCASSASRAKLTASAMAVLLTEPSHVFTIASQLIPRAT